MNSLNRGEWSELYAALYLLENKQLVIVDENLDPICNDIFVVSDILYPEIGRVNYYVVSLNENSNCAQQDNAEQKKESFDDVNPEMLVFAREKLLSIILNAPRGSGSFPIDASISSVKPKIKAGSKRKADLIASVEDLLKNKKVKLSYSIKSMLGSPATMLNASAATNFEYEVRNISNAQMNEINAIKTRTKLKDRLMKIDNFGGEIAFKKVQNDVFENNLRMIDTLMPEILAECLLKSYRSGNKNLLDLFCKSSKITSDVIARKKLADLLQAVSFGMFPKKTWSGNCEVDGGILVVKTNGEVVLLDAIYHNAAVLDFLVNETKLDSPSSSRYHMLELTPDTDKEGSFKFTLNLQIRYKH